MTSVRQGVDILAQNRYQLKLIESSDGILIFLQTNIGFESQIKKCG